MYSSFIIFILIIQCKLSPGYSPRCDEDWNCGYNEEEEEEEQPSSQESSSLRFIFPPVRGNNYQSNISPLYNGYPYNSNNNNNNNYYTPFYGRFGPQGGGGGGGIMEGFPGQFGYSPNNFPLQNFRNRWNMGNYEITGYLREDKLSVENVEDGYIDPDNRPRCPIQNFDMVRSRGLSLYGGRGGGGGFGYPREHREGRILDEDIQIEIENNYDYNYPSLDGYDNNKENDEDVQGRWFLGFKPFRQVYSNDYFRPQEGGYGGVPSAAPAPYPSRRCNDCIWEAELVCQLSVRGDSVRWTRYYDNLFYPRGRYHDILDYYGSRARIDTTDDGTMSRLIIYKVLPEDKGTYACETWNIMDDNWGLENPYNYFQGNGAQKKILTIEFYPQFPQFSSNC